MNRFLPRWRTALTAIGLGIVALTPAQADVILHAFNWKYADVQARAEQIRAAGYRMVLVAPAYKSEGGAWWSRYQPQDYRVIHHPLGDTNAFKAMVNALNAKGVRVYADVILNHMANEAWRRPDLNYPGSAVLTTYAGNTSYYNGLRLFGTLSQNFLGAGDFGSANCINNYSDVWQVQNWRLCGGSGDAGLPDLVANSWVISQQQQYLQALKNMGVKGFRIDAAKHMPNSHMNAVLTSTIKSGMHVFGEIITGGGAGETEYDRFLAPYLSGTDHGAYDFPLFASIRGAFSIGGSMSQLVDPGAFGQALPGSRAVTFTVTHDIPNNSGFRYQIMDPTDETLAYAYVMGRDGGVPMVYSDNNESGDNRWVNAYNRADLKGMIRFHNTVQGSDMQVLSHGQCHIVFRRGNQGIVGINKCGSTVNATVNMNNSVLWWNTNYTDTVGSGNVVRITSGSHTFSLPARTARMWLR
ncbi:MAG: alpha-amylase family glycosyl hydrolase [Inhella sp.]|jgi:alpha-amylase|uniref:alpha-amylase family glycosyl hydrolase n=1 Tax=Inhella sp. TaxID=1921806 RepID=UPI0022C0784C|nr:alpha-amylase family glycosyl hydrolase [Inhella sp.]MCZ8234140.1 alpha-amylase family glycosyl hydrolase [Inhella sp.]